MLAVADTLVKHCCMGNTKYLTWERKYDCRRGCEHAIAAASKDAQQLEEDLVRWKEEARNSRSQHFYLNFFTMQQLIVLQRELAVLERFGHRVADAIPPQVFMLLGAIKPNLLPRDILYAITSGLAGSGAGKALQPAGVAELGISSSTRSPGHTQSLLSSLTTMDFGMDIGDGEEDDVDLLMDQGFSERVAKAALAACRGNVDRAINWAMKYQNDEKRLAAFDALVEKDTPAPDSVFSAPSRPGGSLLGSGMLSMDLDRPASSPQRETSEQKYLSLDELGQILAQLSKQVKSPPECQMPRGLTAGRPNLLVVPEADVLGTVLDLHREHPALPRRSEVLVCTPSTTAEEVSLLFRRALNDPDFRLYCLVHADQLDYSVSSQAMADLEEFLDQISPDFVDLYRLVVVCSRENEEHAWIMSALDQFRCMPTPCLPDELRHYLHKQFTLQARQRVLKPGTEAEWQPAADVDKTRSCVRLVGSERSGVGKSLFIQRCEEELNKLKSNVETLQMCPHAQRNTPIRVSVPVQGNSVNMAAILDVLLEQPPDPALPLSRLIHFDVAPTVRNGLDAFLFDLLVLSTITDGQGRTWRRRSTDLYLIEVTCPELPFTSLALANKFLTDINLTQNRPPIPLGTALPFYILLPAHLCGSPIEAFHSAERKQQISATDPQLEMVEFTTQPYQRVFAYLQQFMQGPNSLDDFLFFSGQITGEPHQCLPLLLKHCGVNDPSWLVVRNFVHFLDVQLRDCEQSTFCQPELVGEELKGFRSFVVRLMMRMSKDFATPSLPIDVLTHEAADEVLQYELRRRWEHTPHPYLFFNYDHSSFLFLGFNVTPNGHLVDPDTGATLENSIMTARLHTGLCLQGVDLAENFLAWNRKQKLERLCKALVPEERLRKDKALMQDKGGEDYFEPDSSYELTVDNMKKILAIQMRFRCGIPVIIMGETGCGKTRLIRFMCRLQAGPKGANNMFMMKIHGGTTENDVRKKVLHAESVAKENAKDDIDTVLFFDEANTTEALGMIREVMCDGRIGGRLLDRTAHLRVIAACNPYRRHTDEMIRRLEEAGLGYHVQAEKTEDKLGRIPLRQLVYRVHPLPGEQDMIHQCARFTSRLLR